VITRRGLVAQAAGFTFAALSGERLWAQFSRFHPTTLTVFKSRRAAVAPSGSTT
jgi:hypothetical protein